MEGDVNFDLTYYPLAAVVFVAYVILFYVGNPVITARFFPKVQSFDRGKQIYWYSSMSSTYNALLSGFLCLVAMFYEDFDHDPIWQDSVIVKSACAMVVGYVAADTILMMVYYKHMKDMGMLFHHMASVYAYFYVMTYGTYVYFANYRLLAELSTPFVNNRWFLDVYGCEKTGRPYFWNGIILTTVFIICRIFTMPWYWYRVFSIYGTEAYLRTGNIKYVLFISCSVLDVLNVVWMYKLLRGVHKTLKLKTDANKNITSQKVE